MQDRKMNVHALVGVLSLHLHHTLDNALMLLLYLEKQLVCGQQGMSFTFVDNWK